MMLHDFQVRPRYPPPTRVGGNRLDGRGIMSMAGRRAAVRAARSASCWRTRSMRSCSKASISLGVTLRSMVHPVE